MRSAITKFLTLVLAILAWQSPAFAQRLVSANGQSQYQGPKEGLAALYIFDSLNSNYVTINGSSVIVKDIAASINNTGELSGTQAQDLTLTGYSANDPNLGFQRLTISSGPVGVLYSHKESARLQTAVAAARVNSMCRASKELTIAVWVQNAEISKPAGNEVPLEAARGLVRQPVRILTMASRTSSGRANRNFVLGQFYEDSGRFKTSVRSTGNGGDAALEDVITNDGFEIQPETVTGVGDLQQVILVRENNGTNRMYVSQGSALVRKRMDRSRSQGDFSNWISDAGIAIGNDYDPDPANMNDGFENRHWKGTIAAAAIYCKALSEDVLLEGRAPNSRTYQAGSVPVQVGKEVTAEEVKAMFIHRRLSGLTVPVDSKIIQDMALDIRNKRPDLAAEKAMEDANFYNFTLKNLAMEMSNRDETINAPLNDFVASFIGIVRDNRNATDLLKGNFFYMGDPNKVAAPSDLVRDILKSNNHFSAIDSGRYNLKDVLVRVDQQRLYDPVGKRAVQNPDPAGLITSRAFMEAHAIAGTNRRPVEFIFREFACKPMDQVAESDGSAEMIGRDVERAPGADPEKFKINCKSCHSVMDSLRPAFAYYNFDQGFVKHSSLFPSADQKMGENDDGLSIEERSRRLNQSQGTSPGVVLKMNHNEQSNTPVVGYFVPNNEWRWTPATKSNRELFSIPTTAKGKGVGALASMIADSPAFAKCMSKRVFRTVCGRHPTDTEAVDINKVAEQWMTGDNTYGLTAAEVKYNMKYLFKAIVNSPKCAGLK